MTWLAKTHASLLAPPEIPRRYQPFQVDDIADAALRKCVRNYGARFWEVAPQGMAPLFVGVAGTHKTVAAACIARAVRDVMLIDVSWVNCASELVQWDRGAFDADTQARIKWLKTVPFLVMDDFTQSLNKSRMMHTLVEIGTARYDALLPTLWTGNVIVSKQSVAELDEAVGVCLARRMLTTSVGFRVLTKKKEER